jgi:N-acetylglucosamine-6-phosphate deacetylase
MIRMVVRNVGIQRIIGMTDGMRSLGLPDGEYFYDDRPYTSRDGVARYPDGTLIGTTMSQSQMAALFCSVTGVSMQEAIEIFSTNPARVLGLDQHKGRVAPGYDADLVVMDSEFTISHTLVAGQTVYTASDTPA